MDCLLDSHRIGHCRDELVGVAVNIHSFSYLILELLSAARISGEHFLAAVSSRPCGSGSLLGGVSIISLEEEGRCLCTLHTL